MKTLLRLGGPGLLFATLISCAPHHEAPLEASFDGEIATLATGEAAQSQNVALYQNVAVSIENEVTTMNHLSTQIFTEAKKDAAGLELVPAGTDNRARSVRVSGLKVDMDVAKPPFLALQNRANLKHLWVEAEEIVIHGAHHFPETQLTLVANKITFADDGQLDVTPKAFLESPGLPGEKDLHGKDGEAGLKSGAIQIFAGSVMMKGGDLPAARLTARGGAGQAAGLGRNGAVRGDMVPVRQAVINGTEYGLVYIEDYHKEWVNWASGCVPFVGCWKTIIGSGSEDRPAVGTRAWPGDGEAAVPGGGPGAGGAGGEIQIVAASWNGQTVSPASAGDLAKFTDISAGPEGAPAGTFQGGRAGQPVKAMQLLTVDNHTDHPHQAQVFRESLAGANAESPRAAAVPGAPGTRQFRSAGALPFSEGFFQQKLRYVRDLYLNRQVKEVEAELASGLLEFGTRELSVGPLPILKLQFVLLQQRLSLQQDYFGHGVNEAPLFDFNFTMLEYEAQIQRSLQMIRFSTRVLDQIKDAQAREDRLRDLVRHYDEVIDQESEQNEKRQTALSELTTTMMSLKNQEEMMARQFADLTAQIEAMAKNTVDGRHANDQLKNNIKVLASICKVVPAYQPALAAAGSLVDHLVNPPDGGQAQEWMKFFEGVSADYNTLTDPAQLQASKDNLASVLGQFRPSNLDGKSLKEKVEYGQKILSQLSPAARQIMEAAQGFNQKTVNNDEIQAEIDRIKSESPMFREVALHLEQYLAQKVKALSEAAALSKEIVDSAVLIEQGLALSTAAGTAQIDHTQISDEGLGTLLERVRADAEDRLLGLHAELIRGYEYATLEKSGLQHLALLRERTERFFATGDIDARMKDLENLYEASRAEILNSVSQKIHNDAAAMSGSASSFLLDLSKDQLRELNEKGLIEVPISARSFGTREVNLRLSNIQVVKANMPQAPKAPGVQRFGLKVLMGTRGDIVDQTGKTHHYEYPNQQDLYWETWYQFQDGRAIATETSRGAASNVLLRVLMDSAHINFAAPVFAEPAALTKLQVMTERNGELLKNPPLAGVRLKISYTSSLR